MKAAPAQLETAQINLNYTDSDRKTAKILGWHVVGERAVEIAQVAAIAIAAGMRVDDLARVPLAFPTYTGNLAYAAASAARELDVQGWWQANKIGANNFWPHSRYPESHLQSETPDN